VAGDFGSNWSLNWYLGFHGRSRHQVLYLSQVINMRQTAKAKGKPNPKKALEILRRIQEMSDRHGGPTKGMTKEQILRSIKKTREELWREYLAPRPRL